MSLNSFRFVVSLIPMLGCMLILQLLRRKYDKLGSIQLIFLLIYSYYFLYTFNWKFCVYIFAVTVLTYISGRLMEEYSKGSRIILMWGGGLLVAFLVYFKYADFFVPPFAKICGKDCVTLNIILPLGISFYIFTALSYLIDIYRGDVKPEKNFLYFTLYFVFFPKLIAGPIVRARDFFSQLYNYRGLSKEAFQVGIQIFVYGLFKKMVIADHLGVFVDDVFYSPTAFNTGTIIWGVLSYSLQIYFDFSGYSDMAIGVSKILGFDFKPNFHFPYMAENESDFWSRWHISLSLWFRDYVYIPLGGNRKGEVRIYLNLFITMILSGLWHGEGWTFFLWGILHGAMSCIHRFFKKRGYKGIKCVNIAITFITVTLFWVIFRADSLSNAVDIFVGMFTIHTGIHQPYVWTGFALVVLVIVTIMAKKKSAEYGIENDKGFYPVMDLSKFWSQVAFFILCGLTIIMGYYGDTAFIYGKF